MKQEDVNKATDIILEALLKSDLDKCVKLELLVNLKKFLGSYNDNLKILIDAQKRFKPF